MTVPCKLSFHNLDNSGYSHLTINGRRVLAHRRALEQKLGRPLRDGYETCHTCDVKNCIEPEHLYEGTRSQNLKDSYRRSNRVGWGDGFNGKKTHCPQGHPLSGDNVNTWAGSRYCRKCKNERSKLRYRNKKDKKS